jgi:hypothetical protein
MAFMEKVWAKTSGNYEITEGGWTPEVLQFLTGSPTVSIGNGNAPWTSASAIWNYINTQD